MVPEAPPGIPHVTRPSTGCAFAAIVLAWLAALLATPVVLAAQPDLRGVRDGGPPPASWTAPADAPFLPLDGAWPGRLPPPAAPAERGVVRVFEGPIQAWFKRHATWEPLARRDSDDVDLAAWLGRPADADAPTLEGINSLVFGFEVTLGAEAVTFKPADRPTMGLVFISAEPPHELDAAAGLELRRPVLQRTAFAVYEPQVRKPGKPPGPMPHARWRGTALLMPGMFGTPELVMDEFTRRLRGDGWWVVRMLSQPSRFTERIEFIIDPSSDPKPAAARIADRLSTRAAECAYAARAALSRIESIRPELAELPRVAIGNSGGAMTLPTVVALEPDRYAAAVLIGGGADYWLISLRSNYRELIGAIRVDWIGDEPSEAWQRALDIEYLASAPLDPYHASALLRGKPVLVHHAALDRAVPAALGDLLWRRLGEPRRTTVNFGHEFLFLLLGRHYDEMLTFLSDAVRPAASPPRPPP